jgi:hypothetical protein
VLPGCLHNIQLSLFSRLLYKSKHHSRGFVCFDKNLVCLFVKIQISRVVKQCHLSQLSRFDVCQTSSRSEMGSPTAFIIIVYKQERCILETCATKQLRNDPDLSQTGGNFYFGENICFQRDEKLYSECQLPWDIPYLTFDGRHTNNSLSC